jgi:hypothetical protein
MSVQKRNLEALQVITVRENATLASDTSTTGVDFKNIDGDAMFILTSVASGNPAHIIKVKLQHSNTTSTGDYEDVPGGAFTDLGDAASVQKLVIPRSDLRRYYRLTSTDRASFSAAVSCVAVGTSRYMV